MSKAEASEPQLRAIRNLLGVRQLDGDVEERLRRLLEQHDLAVQTPGEVPLISPGKASQMIDWLLGQPWKPRDGQGGGQGGEAAEPGVYRKHGRVFVVREFHDDGRKVRYAREIVARAGGQGDRLDAYGQQVRYQEQKASRMQYQLGPADLLPMEEFARLGIQTGTCVACGARLEVAESVAAGYGPVCGRRQRQRLDAAATLAADERAGG
jgi:predicted RNA-binding Zn-ribbon protein involved in translation (DUF1610 family)